MKKVVNNIAFTNDNPKEGEAINLFDSYTFDEWLEHRNDEAYRHDWAKRYAMKRQERLERQKAEEELEAQIDLLVQKALDKELEKFFDK